MKHSSPLRWSNFVRAACISTLTLTAACEDTVQVLLRDDDSDAATGGYSDSGSSLGYSDSGSSFEYSDAGSELEDSDSGTSFGYSDAGTSQAWEDDARDETCGGQDAVCTLQPSGKRTSRCTRQNRSCTSWGLALTDFTYLGCADEVGFAGNAKIVVGTCAEALHGESGQSCSADLDCRARSRDDACCVDRAQCDAGGSLRAARLCVPDCGKKPSLAGAVLTSCAELYAAADEEDATGKWYAWGLGVIGRACAGSFLCGGRFDHAASVGEGRFIDSHGHYAFCGEGRVQLITEGSSTLPESDGDPFP